VERLVCSKLEFESIAHAKQVFQKFYDTYNKKRMLKCLLNKIPDEFLDDWDDGRLSVAYNIKTKKQKFFLREKQSLKELRPSSKESLCVLTKII